MDHLGVPHGAQLASQPREVLTRVGDRLGVEEGAVGAEGASEATCRDPHLVHRVRQITSYRDIRGQEVTDVACEHATERIDGQAVGSDGWELGHIGGTHLAECRRRLAERTRSGTSRLEGCSYVGRGPGSRRGVGDDLEFEFAEGRAPTVRIDVDMIIDQFEECLIGGRGDDERRPMRPDAGPVEEVLAAEQRAEDLHECCGDRPVGGGHAYLVACRCGCSRDGDLGMPSVIHASCAVAQRDPPAQESGRCGVDVVRLESHRIVGVDPVVVTEVGEGEVGVDPVLELGFAHFLGHSDNPRLLVMSMSVSWYSRR